MARPYSIDLRERLIAAVAEGESVRAAGEIFDVSQSFVAKLAQRWRPSGSIDPLKSDGDRRSGAIEAQRDWLSQTIEKTPDLTLREIRDRLGKRGTSTSTPSGARFFQRHRFSCKKKLHATEWDRADVSAAIEAWTGQQPGFDAARLAFLDETSMTTNMARTCGRSPMVERLVAAIPQVHWKTTTFVAALRLNDMTASLVTDGQMTGALFLAYVEQQLVPTLSSGDIVVMDNVSVHHIDGVEPAITAKGGTIRHLPPQCPDMNLIELAFAKLKPMLRQAAKRSIRNPWRRIADIQPRPATRVPKPFFAHDGYVCI